MAACGGSIRKVAALATVVGCRGRQPIDGCSLTHMRSSHVRDTDACGAWMISQGNVVQEATSNRKLRRDHMLLWLRVAIAVVVMATAAVPIDTRAQLWLAAGLLVVMLAVRRLAGHEEERPRLKQWLRVVLLFLGAYLTARYFFWRTFTTLSYYDIASYCAALALYAAEEINRDAVY